MCPVLSSLTREDEMSIDGAQCTDVCPVASHSATFHWEWNGLYIYITYVHKMFVPYRQFPSIHGLAGCSLFRRCC